MTFAWDAPEIGDASAFIEHSFELKSPAALSYQIVFTDPEFRRQGLCGTLVFETARLAFQNTEVDTLVMCADPDYFAIKIYESCGFRRNALEYGVSWADPKRTS